MNSTIGKLKPVRTLIFSITIIFVTLSAIYFPFSAYGTISKFYEQNRWAWSWPIVVILFLYFTYVSSMLILRVIFFKRIALYYNNFEIIFLFRHFLKINRDDIVDVYLQRKYGFAKNIAIVRKNGKKRWLWATFIEEPEQNIVVEVKRLSHN